MSSTIHGIGQPSPNPIMFPSHMICLLSYLSPASESIVCRRNTLPSIMYHGIMAYGKLVTVFRSTEIDQCYELEHDDIAHHKHKNREDE